MQITLHISAWRR